MLPVAVVGCGGHSKVVTSSLRVAGRKIVAYACSDPSVVDSRFFLGEILSDDELMKRFSPDQIEVVLGLGSVLPNVSDSRMIQVAKRYIQMGYQIVGFFHPSAWVAPETVIHRSAQILAGAIVQPGAQVDSFCIINTKVSIDHDCHIESFCHLAPGVTLSGNVQIGSGSHLGTGSTVIQGIRIGKNSMIAAGSVVIKDVPDGCWVKGVPAKPFQTKTYPSS